MFCAALISRSWEAPQTGHAQYRTLRSFTSGFFVPQQWQIWEDGKNLSTIMSSFPYHSVLYESCRRTSPQEASMMDFANLWFLTMFFTDRFSIQMTSFFRTRFVVILWMASFRWLAIFSWSRATRSFAFSWFLLPFVFRESCRWRRASFFLFLV